MFPSASFHPCDHRVGGSSSLSGEEGAEGRMISPLSLFVLSRLCAQPSYAYTCCEYLSNIPHGGRDAAASSPERSLHGVRDTEEMVQQVERPCRRVCSLAYQKDVTRSGDL